MNITVAGKKKDVAEGITVTELIEQEQIENAQYVTVTVNEEFLQRDDFTATKLKENDVVEFLYFMGGGSVRRSF